MATSRGETRMTSPAMQTPLGATLWKVAKLKVQIRWLFVQYGLSSAGFWTVFAIGGSWARHAGYGWLATLAIGVWGVLALPLLYLQLSLIVDMIGYLFTGNITFFP